MRALLAPAILAVGLLASPAFAEPHDAHAGDVAEKRRFVARFAVEVPSSASPVVVRPTDATLTWIIDVPAVLSDDFVGAGDGPTVTRADVVDWPSLRLDGGHYRAGPPQRHPDETPPKWFGVYRVEKEDRSALE